MQRAKGRGSPTDSPLAIGIWTGLSCVLVSAVQSVPVPLHLLLMTSAEIFTAPGSCEMQPHLGVKGIVSAKVSRSGVLGFHVGKQRPRLCRACAFRTFKPLGPDMVP